MIHYQAEVDAVKNAGPGVAGEPRATNAPLAGVPVLMMTVAFIWPWVRVDALERRMAAIERTIAVRVSGYGGSEPIEGCVVRPLDARPSRRVRT
jgi:hypothetical protein